MTVAYGGRSGSAQRLRELELRLKDAAAAAVQLGIPPEKAAETFHKMIHDLANHEDNEA